MVSTRHRILQGFGAMLGAEFARVVSKGLLVLLLTRVFLTPDQYGLLFLAMSVLGVGLLFSYLGLAKSAARYLAEYRRNDASQVAHIIVVVGRSYAVTITVVAGGVILLSGPISTWLGEPMLQPLLVVGAGYLAGSTLTHFASQVFQGFNRVRWSAAVATVSSVSILAAVVVFLLLGYGALGGMLGYAVGVIVAAAFGMVVLYRRFYRPATRGPRRPGLARDVLRYSVPLTATRGAQTLDQHVDTILVGFFMNPAAVAFYTLGKQVSEFLIAPATSLGFAISPTYGEQKAAGDLDHGARLYEQTVTYTTLFYLPLGIGLFLLARPGVAYVIGPDYLGAVVVIQLFSVYVFLRALDKLTNDALDFLGRARIRAIAKSGASTGNFVLNLLLIPTLGVAGAAIATVLAQLSLVAVELWAVDQEFDLDRSRLLRRTGSCLLPAIPMGLVLVGLRPYVTGLAPLLGLLVVASGVWLAIAILTGLVDLGQLRSLLATSDA